MIDHITVAVNDLAASKLFYERAFVPLGYTVSFGEDGVFWAFDIGDGLFEIRQADNEAPLTRLHVAFRANSRSEVDAFYRAARDAGAEDNGPPGPRPQYTPNYYACFVLDPNGYNIEAMVDRRE